MQLLVANYKMNGDKEFFLTVQHKVNKLKLKDTKLVLCPPFVYLQSFNCKNKNIVLGSQDICITESDKSTGQISATMLKDCNVSFCIVGHSERRAIGETDTQINLKIKNACQNNITPIICVGEENKTASKETIKQQVKSALNGLDKQCKVVFAYEPVWAIGTGETPTIKQINETIKIIRNQIKSLGFEPQVLYGGSVNEQNYKELLMCDVDGFLMGAVALNTDSLIELVKGCVK